MKSIFIGAILLFGLSFNTVKAEDGSKEIKFLKTEVDSLKNQQERLHDEIKTLSLRNIKAERQISDMQHENMELSSSVDSLQKECNALVANQKADKSELATSIDETNTMIQTTENMLSSRTLWGMCGLMVLLIAIIGIVVAFLKKFRAGTTSIDNVRKTQELLQATQTKMQEESVKLDNQLLAIVQKQLDASTSSASKTTGEPDHSLVVKLADEIARIETNLSKMDKSVKGYKQLVQAKDRMINNVRANGYEIISLLGQEYNDGMQFQARFVPDESLPEGKRIITGMIKMQVNYNGKMIQPAQIVVSQNI